MNVITTINYYEEGYKVVYDNTQSYYLDKKIIFNLSLRMYL